jgi:hypothetical protein
MASPYQFLGGGEGGAGEDFLDDALSANTKMSNIFIAIQIHGLLVCRYH